ncbi:MAG TPA: hypothetical protein VIY29_28955, partial [Ktedonobacteraceae bacterium]
MNGGSSRAALGADHERVPGQVTEEVGFAKVGVAEVRIDTYRRSVFFQSFHVATPRRSVSS